MEERLHVVFVGPSGWKRDLRHRVERRRRRDARDARHRTEAADRQIGARFQRLAELGLMRPVPVERAGDGVLHRHVAAQAAVGELLHRRRHPVQPRRAAACHPARAPAGREVGLRQARERDDWRVRIELAVGVDRAVEAEVAVHLVGQDQQPVLIGEVEQRAARLGRVHGAGRVVGIDDDERARGRRDQALEVIEVRHPSARRVEPVVLRRGVELGEHRGVERIGGHRYEHLAARVDDGAQRELDAFRCAGGDEHAIGGDRKTVPGVLLGHRFPRGRDPGRRPVVVVTIPHRPLDRGNEVRRRLEAERDRIADVEVAHAGARRFHLLRFHDDVADGVGKAVHAGGRLNGCLGFRGGHRAILLVLERPFILLPR